MGWSNLKWCSIIGERGGAQGTQHATAVFGGRLTVLTKAGKTGVVVRVAQLERTSDSPRPKGALAPAVTVHGGLVHTLGVWRCELARATNGAGVTSSRPRLPLGARVTFAVRFDAVVFQIRLVGVARKTQNVRRVWHVNDAVVGGDVSLTVSGREGVARVCRHGDVLAGQRDRLALAVGTSVLNTRDTRWTTFRRKGQTKGLRSVQLIQLVHRTSVSEHLATLVIRFILCIWDKFPADGTIGALNVIFDVFLTVEGDGATSGRRRRSRSFLLRS